MMAVSERSNYENSNLDDASSSRYVIATHKKNPSAHPSLEVSWVGGCGGVRDGQISSSGLSLD